LSHGVMLYVWMSHVLHMNESNPSYKWVMSQIHHINESWLIHTSHVVRVSESCPSYEWVKSII